GELVDERQLYRIEVVARDRVNGPFWLSTVGMGRLLKPELELLEIPAPLLRTALELLDATAARLVTAGLPHAGVPFEVGPEVRCALVPAREAAETIATDAAGGEHDRHRLPPGPRAAICAAGKRGTYRQVWTPPIEALDQLASGRAALYLAARVVDARARLARRTWPALVHAFASRTAPDACLISAKILLAEGGGTTTDEPAARAYAWLDLDEADASGGSGTLAHDVPSIGLAAGAKLSFELPAISDWRAHGLRADAPEIGPESATLL
ncbi:MAG: DUF4026 domain-containing protein, partial [Planctomycetota bacterium]